MRKATRSIRFVGRFCAGGTKARCRGLPCQPSPTGNRNTGLSGSHVGSGQERLIEVIAEKLQATNDGDGLSAALDDFCRLLLLGGPSGTRIRSRIRRGRGDRAHGVPGFAGDALRRGVVDATVVPSRSATCRRFRGTRRAAGASRKAVPFPTRTAQVGLDGGASRANLGRLNRVPFRFCRHDGTVRAAQR
ncbi:hypothetical protein [Streptomyces sp. NPDC006477]|uniref:hypothetical protein n=1 Tax=Streptomyces sp. NPDC006477 TaxID=3364747 RepID=UPI0036A5D14E